MVFSSMATPETRLRWKVIKAGAKIFGLALIPAEDVDGQAQPPENVHDAGICDPQTVKPEQGHRNECNDEGEIKGH